jgi:hypothetical protein
MNGWKKVLAARDVIKLQLSDLLLKAYNIKESMLYKLNELDNITYSEFISLLRDKTASDLISTLQRYKYSPAMYPFQKRDQVYS